MEEFSLSLYGKKYSLPELYSCLEMIGDKNIEDRYSFTYRGKRLNKHLDAIANYFREIKMQTT